MDFHEKGDFNAKVTAKVSKPDFNGDRGSFTAHSGNPGEQPFSLLAVCRPDQQFLFLGRNTIKQGETYELGPGKPYAFTYKERVSEISLVSRGSITFHVFNFDGRKAKVSFDLFATDPLENRSDIHIVGEGTFDAQTGSLEFPDWAQKELDAFLAKKI
jgi:hypothetical protein